MPNVFYPYKAGAKSPIPYMHEEIAENLDDYEVAMFSIEESGATDGGHVSETYLPQTESNWRRVGRYVRPCLRSYDLIHTGGRAPRQLPMARLTKLRNPGLPHVHTLRVDVDPESEVGPYEQKRKLVEMADAVTAVSEHTAGTAAEHFGVTPEVIYEGVNPDIFHPDYNPPTVLKEYGVDSPFVLFVGSFQERKNPSAVVRIAEELPEATFLMIGDGPLHDQVSRLANGVDNVVLTGRLPKETLPAVYAQAAGFAFPTVREGCPNVMLEAMASEVPVVGYRATSMPEVVEHGTTGYLADPGNEDELRAHVERLLSDANRDEMGVRAREHVVDNHSFEVLSDQYEALYDDLLRT